MDGNYGVHRDIFSYVKMGFFYLRDLAVIGGFGLIGFSLQGIFPETQSIQKLLFILLNLIMGAYFVLPANGNKKNYNVFYVYFKRIVRKQKKYFKSINRFEKIV